MRIPFCLAPWVGEMVLVWGRQDPYISGQGRGQVGHPSAWLGGGWEKVLG